MKIRTAFFKDFITDFNWPTDELANRLTLIGHESEALNRDEVNVEIFPNRGDCLSLYGLARELTGFYPEVGDLRVVEKVDLPTPQEFFSLQIAEKAKKLVLSDHLLKIENYRQTSSPKELVEKMRAIGLQPKDLLVDLTNLITYGLGLPMHVFDYEQVKSGLQIDVSVEGEKVALLDGKSLTLPKGLLIQRSDGEVVDLAGTMGAQNSAVSSKSGTVLVQAAVFAPQAVRRNSRSTGIVTEASYRFQRGVDPAMCQTALGRLLKIVTQLVPEVKVTGYQSYEQKISPTIIDVSPEQVSRILGEDISTQNLKALSRLGFKYEDSTLAVPTYRMDVKVVADVAEEVARVIGLNHIKPQELAKQKTKRVGEYYEILSLKQLIACLGFNEAITNSLTKGTGEVQIKNPRSVDQTTLRKTLKDGLLQVLSRNPYLRRTQFFEVGHIFKPEEQNVAGFILAGYKESMVKQVADQLSDTLGTTVAFEPISTEEADEYDVKQSKLWFAEFPVSSFKKGITNFPSVKLPQYQPISKLPPIVRDVTLLINTVDQDTLMKSLTQTPEPGVLFVELVDIFTSEEKLGKDKVAVTYRFFLQNLNRSLRDEEADKLMVKIFNNLKGLVEFEIR